MKLVYSPSPSIASSPSFSKYCIREKKTMYEKMYDRMQISLSLCVYLWCELDVQCRVIGAQEFCRFFCHPGAEKGHQGSMSVYFIFSNIYHAKKDTPSIEHASSERRMAGRKGKRIIFRLEKRLQMCRKLFFCNFYHRLTLVLCLSWRCYESIIWLSFILSSISNGDWNSS